MLDNVGGMPHNSNTTKVVNNSKTIKQDTLYRKEAKMTTLTVGSQFTTAKSGVVGTIQEIIKNPSGSARVRLDVNGQPRWTTVK
jgi:hypothetical protein